MKCPECGTENSKDAKFCEECGKKLPEHMEIPKQSNSSGKMVKSSKFGGISSKMIIAAVGVVVVIGLIGIYAISTSTASASPQNGTVFVWNTVSGTVNVVVDGVTTKYTIDKANLGSGSGFIVSKDGYIVTAAHVVGDPRALTEDGKITRMDDDKVKFYLCRAAAAQWLESKSPGILNKITIAQLNQLTTQGIASGELQPSNTEQNIYILGPAISDVENPPVARIVDMGDSSTEIDVALLKIDNLKENLPVLKVSSDPISIGENLNTYGYPTEQFDFYNGLSNKGSNKDIWKSMLTASLTRGIVSAERPSPKGMQYYQTDAAVDHGNSGGPVLNDENQVIGILVMGFDKQGFNFFIPSKYITEMCQKNGVNLGGGFF